MRPIEILLVEDNPGDIRLTQEMLKDTRITSSLHVARNGIEAMEFLLKGGPFLHSPTPDLVLLDLNLPRKNGREVLSEMKSSDSLRHIPVIILAAAEACSDLIESFNLQIRWFVAKPLSHRDLEKAIESFEALKPLR